MSEAEGEWADLMHTQETSTVQVSKTSQASPVAGPPDTVPETKRYRTSPAKGTKLATMAHFFGPVGSSATGAGRGLVTRTRNLYHREDGKMVQVQYSNTRPMETVADPKYAAKYGADVFKTFHCPKNCGFATTHPPALSHHIKTNKCEPRKKDTDGDTLPTNQAGPSTGGSSSSASARTTGPKVAALSGSPSEPDLGQDVSMQEERVGQKRKKGGGFKTSGLRQGDKRRSYSIYYRYQVVLKCKELADEGNRFPTDSVAAMYGIHKSLVSKWNKKAAELKDALQDPDRQRPGHADYVTKEHPRAKRIFLRREKYKGTGLWPLAEELVYREYKRRRSQGIRVTKHTIRALMRQNLIKYYGEDVSAKFRCSSRWMTRFKQYWGIASRRRTEKKHEPMDLKLPRIKRWHARLRLRLKKGDQQHLHPVWGRWLPENRLNVDQVSHL